MIPTVYHVAEVLSNDLIGEQVRYLKLKTLDPLPYEAGQFFMLRLRNAQGEYVERSYSAANFANEPVIEFVIRIEAQGQMTSIIDTLRPGDRLDMKGPFGRFGFGSLSDPVQKLVLIAGGVGVSPLRSMIQKSFHRGDTFPIQLFYGFRTPSDFLFREELEGYTSSGRFEIVPALSEASDTWSGATGYVSDCLEGKIFSPDSGAQCFLCGPPPMVKATREKLFSLGFDRKQVHVEAW